MDKMQELSAQIAQMHDIGNQVDEAEITLKSLKEQYRDVNERVIPALMEEIGLAEVKTSDGRKISVQKVYQAHISAKNKELAFKWLAEHGHDGLIKQTVVAHASDDDHAVQAIEKLCGMGFEVESKKAVHPSTLKAFVKEQLESGKDLPREAFGVYETHKTTVK